MSGMHSPQSQFWTNSIAVCATMKDENVTDVKEWLRYYRWLGVDHVFLTDNASADGQTTLSRLRAAFPSSFLTLRTEARPRAQLKVYAWCAEELRSLFNWIAFFDLDEYLVVRRPAGEPPNLKGLLDEYKHEGGLGVPWVWVGPSGRERRVPAGGVLRDYTQCIPEAADHMKTIANTYFMEGVAVHPHNVQYYPGHAAVSERHAPIPEMWKAYPWGKVKEDGETVDLCPRLIARGADEATMAASCYRTANDGVPEPSIDRVALFHYATKSVEDFQAKMARGSGMSARTKGTDYFDRLAEGQTDDPLCKLPATLWSHCCSNTQ